MDIHKTVRVLWVLATTFLKRTGEKQIHAENPCTLVAKNNKCVILKVVLLKVQSHVPIESLRLVSESKCTEVPMPSRCTRT
jgi:hypothetical protein